MADNGHDDRRDRRPPEAGWTLGAGGLPRPVWGGIALALLALAVVLFALGYIGYGAMIVVLSAAAAVNLWEI